MGITPHALMDVAAGVGVRMPSWFPEYGLGLFFFSFVILVKGPYGTPSMAKIDGLGGGGCGSSCEGGGRGGSGGSRAAEFSLGRPERRRNAEQFRSVVFEK